jgi:hypothetical protein
MNRQEKSFIKASVGAILYVAIAGVAGMVTPFFIFFAYLAYIGGIALVSQTWNGSPDVNPYTQLLDRLFLPVAFIGLIVGMVIGVRLWNHIFVESAYLDNRTLECIKENAAPTPRMERIRKAIGFSFLIPFLLWVNWGVYLKPIKDWWILLVTLPLLSYFVYRAFKEYGSGKQ